MKERGLYLCPEFFWGDIRTGKEYVYDYLIPNKLIGDAKENSNFLCIFRQVCHK